MKKTMNYLDYKKYGWKLKMYKFVTGVLLIGLLCLYVKLSQMGLSADQMISLIYIFCFLVVVILIGIKFGSRAVKRHKYLNSPLAAVDHMTGVEFERYLKAHFENLGYKVKLTADTGDFGADLVCKKDGETTIVQAKRYKKQVGIEAIQQIAAARAYYKADKLMVVTNSFFTRAAKELASSNNVELWDRNSINKLLIMRDGKKEIEKEIDVNKEDAC